MEVYMEEELIEAGERLAITSEELLEALYREDFDESDTDNLKIAIRHWRDTLAQVHPAPGDPFIGHTDD